MSVQSDNPPSLDRRIGRSAFGFDAQGYDDARSGYPDQLFDLLASKTVPGPRVAEIGSGTGLASEGLFALSPSQVTMIEPDARLCAFLEQRFARPDAQIICAPFPDVEVKDTFDLVTCAAAFHWMEPAPALAKIQSMLVPGGIWAMWWNSYFGHGIDDAFADKMARIMTEEGVRLPPSYVGSKHYAFDTDHHISTLNYAEFQDIEHSLFTTHRTFTAAQACQLFASFSFINILSDTDQERIFKRISTVIDTQFGGIAHSLCATSLYVSRSAR